MEAKDFDRLAQKIFLSPSPEILNNCLRYLESVSGDISLLKSMDLGGHPISYVCRQSGGEMALDLRDKTENRHLLKLLFSDYDIPNISRKIQ